MSIKMMTKVFGLALEPAKKLLLLALTDHADDDGHECWPSVPYLAWKTSLSESHIRRMMKTLRDEGVLIPIAREGGGRHRSTVYRIELDPLPTKEPLGRRSRGLSPVAEAGHVRAAANSNGRGGESRDLAEPSEDEESLSE